MRDIYDPAKPDMNVRDAWTAGWVAADMLLSADTNAVNTTLYGMPMAVRNDRPVGAEPNARRSDSEEVVLRLSLPRVRELAAGILAEVRTTGSPMRSLQAACLFTAEESRDWMRLRNSFNGFHIVHDDNILEWTAAARALAAYQGELAERARVRNGQRQRVCQ